MAEEKTSLSPRETAMRMLQHAHDDVSYEDIVRQLRILQHIEWVTTDLEMGEPSADPSDQVTAHEVERPRRMSLTAEEPSLVLRSHPHYSWRSLAERSEDQSGSPCDPETSGSDPALGEASWNY